MYPPIRALRTIPRLSLLCALALPCGASLAVPSITDPVGDFLPSFAGPRTPDLDLVTATAVYDTTTRSYTLTTTFAGPFGVELTDYASHQVFWGVDTGTGTAQLASLGLTGVYYDTTIQLLGYGSSGVGSVGDTILPLGSVSIANGALSVTFSDALLPSSGYAPGKLLWSVWTWYAFVQGPLVQIADIAPSNASFTAATVPEPASLPMLLLGAATMALWRRRANPGR